MWTKDRITIPEAVLTLSFFFVLIIVAYIADKIKERSIKNKQGKESASQGGKPDEAGLKFNIEDFYHILKAVRAEESIQKKGKQNKNSTGNLEEAKSDNEAIQKLDKSEDEKEPEDNNKLKTMRGQLEAYLKETFKVDDIGQLNPEDVKDALQPRSVIDRVKYKRIVANQLSGRKPFIVVKGMKKQVENQLAESLKKTELNPHVGFKCLHYSVTEGAGQLKVLIYKKTNYALEIGIRTRDGTATAPDDYHSIDQVLVFGQTEHEKEVSIDIVDDNEWEPDEDFYVELYDVNTQKRLEGKDTETIVTIIDDDQPGQLGFFTAKLSCQPKNKVLRVKVVRKKGCDGIVKVRYQIKEADGKAKHLAKPYEHFIPRTDTLIFEHGETEKEIKVDIIEIADEDPNRDDAFMIRLFDVEPQGAKITKKDSCIIHIVGSNELDHKVEDIEKVLDIMRKSNEVTWAQQFKRA